MTAAVTGNLAGVARPSPKLRRALGIMHGPAIVARMDRIFEDSIAIDALAKVLDKGLEKTATNGNLDLKALAAYVLAEVRGAQR